MNKMDRDYNNHNKGYDLKTFIIELILKNNK